MVELKDAPLAACWVDCLEVRMAASWGRPMVAPMVVSLAVQMVVKKVEQMVVH